MRTANQPASAAVTRLSLAQQIVEQLLQVRRVFLKGRAPKSKYLHWLRRDMACGKVRNVEQLLALSCADLLDGAPIVAVTAPYATMIALLEEEGRRLERQRPQGEPSLLALVRRETDAQNELDKAESWALAEPQNPDALAAIEVEAARYDAAERSLIGAVRRRLARHRLSVGSR